MLASGYTKFYFQLKNILQRDEAMMEWALPIIAVVLWILFRKKTSVITLLIVIALLVLASGMLGLFYAGLAERYPVAVNATATAPNPDYMSRSMEWYIASLATLLVLLYIVFQEAFEYTTRRWF